MTEKIRIYKCVNCEHPISFDNYMGWFHFNREKYERTKTNLNVEGVTIQCECGCQNPKRKKMRRPRFVVHKPVIEKDMWVIFDRIDKIHYRDKCFLPKVICFSTYQIARQRCVALNEKYGKKGLP